MRIYMQAVALLSQLFLNYPVLYDIDRGGRIGLDVQSFGFGLKTIAAPRDVSLILS